MGDGFVGWAANVICIAWTLFVCVIFSLPTVLPVTAENMNYASVRIFLLTREIVVLISSGCCRSSRQAWSSCPVYGTCLVAIVITTDPVRISPIPKITPSTVTHYKRKSNAVRSHRLDLRLIFYLAGDYEIDIYITLYTDALDVFCCYSTALRIETL